MAFYRLIHWRKRSTSTGLVEYNENFPSDLMLLFSNCSNVVHKYLRESPNLKQSFQSRHGSYLYDDTSSIFCWKAFYIQNRNILEFSFVVPLPDSRSNVRL